MKILMGLIASASRRAQITGRHQDGQSTTNLQALLSLSLFLWPPPLTKPPPTLPFPIQWSLNYPLLQEGPPQHGRPNADHVWNWGFSARCRNLAPQPFETGMAVWDEQTRNWFNLRIHPLAYPNSLPMYLLCLTGYSHQKVFDFCSLFYH